MSLSHFDPCSSACPASNHLGWSVERSLAQKHAWLAQRLAPWAERLEAVRSVAPEGRWGYRDRVALSVQWGDGGGQFGVRRRDVLIPSPDCPIHTPRVRDTVRLLMASLPGREGFALTFLVQSGAQAVLVLKQSAAAPTAWFTPALERALQGVGIEGLWLHYYPGAGRHHFTKRGWQRLWGRPRAQDDAGLWYGPGAFGQPLPSLHAQALDEAQAFIASGPGDRCIDLYCGRGLSLRRWLATGAEALGGGTGG